MKKLLLLSLFLTGCAAQYEKYQTVNTLPPIFDQDQISRYLLTQYKGALNEQARVIYYRDNKYISDEVVGNGGVANVATNGLKIVIDCTIKKCNRVVLAHNHPGQYFASPSSTDLDSNDKFNEMMKQANIIGSYVITADSDVNWVQ